MSVRSHSGIPHAHGPACAPAPRASRDDRQMLAQSFAAGSGRGSQKEPRIARADEATPDSLDDGAESAWPVAWCWCSSSAPIAAAKRQRPLLGISMLGMPNRTEQDRTERCAVGAAQGVLLANSSAVSGARQLLWDEPWSFLGLALARRSKKKNR